MKKIRDEEKSKRVELEKSKKEWHEKNSKNVLSLKEKDISEVVASWTGIPVSKVSETENEKFIGIYNFSEYEEMAWIDEQDGLYKELLTKQKDFKASGLKLPGHGILWLWRSKKA